MEQPVRRKLTARVDYSRPVSRDGATPVSRPASPTKFRTIPSPTLTPTNAIRPKAKVNSSATVLPRKLSATMSTSSMSSVGRPQSVPSIPPRATSPFKPSQGTNGSVSPTLGPVKARVTARAPLRPAIQSTPASPASSNYGPTSPHLKPSPSPSPPSPTRTRQPSLSHSVSFGALNYRPPSSPLSQASDIPPVPQLPPSLRDSPPGSGGVRIKSKVTGLVKAGLPSTPRPQSPYATTRTVQPRPRAPSISTIYQLSGSTPPSAPPTQSIYPITTCAPTANPHRYTPARPPQYQTFPPPPPPPAEKLANDSRNGYTSVVAKVNPESIPLPPQSPPMSAVSFSSRSSTSRSSISYHTRKTSSSTAPTLNSHVNGLGLVTDGGDVDRHSHSSSGSRSTSTSRGGSSLDGDSSDVSRRRSSRETHRDSAVNDAERKMKAEAKSNRKIADLEITNRSLMVINASLEATKHRQAKEIRDLRRKLRESRLILPPRTYRAVKSSLENDDTADEDDEEEDEEDEDDDDDSDKVVDDDKEDPSYKRVKNMLDTLLEAGRRALESKPEDFEGGGGGAKVLSAEEVQSWRHKGGIESESEAQDDGDSYVETDAETSFSSSTSPSQVAVPDSDSDLGSEAEVEALMSQPLFYPPAPLPPITLSQSP
ncbi:hypothetical protein JAAARDRAFT_53468 [Jaapia argillacea MUCL 33604]|uniref:Uncharacterized protein n=1 Tax=Jaapia argillacea MUCL 33604 TaxID=933084 RepID=A0A067QI93_9AGAM|nr:hypothetical protein JAAARDRAFT_53468 [Jaapia argillacea MUCL 33604]